MAASANPSGVHRNGNNNNNNGNSNGSVPENTSGSGVSLPGTAQTALRHNPGLSLDWTPEEQSTLEDLLTKYASETNIIRYAKIAQALKDKTVRDVALRCRWMNKKENGKRRKDDNNSRKSKDKKEKAIDSLPKSSQVANRSNGPPYVQPMLMESDDGISYKDFSQPSPAVSSPLEFECFKDNLIGSPTSWSRSTCLQGNLEVNSFYMFLRLLSANST
ncbi:uncharacterized protein LOC131006504 isoform X2 [Salvia miltiorrhiza]|uniref:uncharacterized protein LOC131006504 isoform X2 n=1 Tax=Salvia miltiorrhiza TaxID=226208 RepID=UPI0025ACCEB3|nr:uncharacterized protein LOC131006504 isoform X2 [Salvia miltiorrhiza]